MRLVSRASVSKAGQQPYYDALASFENVYHLLIYIRERKYFNITLYNINKKCDRGGIITYKQACILRGISMRRWK